MVSMTSSASYRYSVNLAHCGYGLRTAACWDGESSAGVEYEQDEVDIERRHCPLSSQARFTGGSIHCRHVRQVGPYSKTII